MFHRRNPPPLSLGGISLTPHPAVGTQQSADAQPQMDSSMSLRGGCSESIDCCGITEGCGCC